MPEISTRDLGQRSIKVKNTRNDAVVDAILDKVSHDGKSITVIIAKNKIQMNRLPGKPGFWVTNALGMELTCYYVP
jgi:hypothetical protein